MKLFVLLLLALVSFSEAADDVLPFCVGNKTVGKDCDLPCVSYFVKNQLDNDLCCCAPRQVDMRMYLKDGKAGYSVA